MGLISYVKKNFLNFTIAFIMIVILLKITNLGITKENILEPEISTTNEIVSENNIESKQSRSSKVTIDDVDIPEISNGYSNKINIKVNKDKVIRECIRLESRLSNYYQLDTGDFKSNTLPSIDYILSILENKYNNNLEALYGNVNHAVNEVFQYLKLYQQRKTSYIYIPSNVGCLISPFNKGLTKFVTKEGLDIYKQKLKHQQWKEKQEYKEKMEREKERKKMIYNFKRKRDKALKNEQMQRIFKKYRNIWANMPRKQLIDLVKILDEILKNQIFYFPEDINYYNINHEIQDKLFTIDKEYYDEIEEYLDNPEEVVKKYNIKYNWKEKASITLGLWILYTDSNIEVDDEFIAMVEDNWYNRINNYINKELEAYKEFNSNYNIMPLPTMPVTPGM